VLKSAITLIVIPAKATHLSDPPEPTPRAAPPVAALENNLIALGFDEHSNSITTEIPRAHAAPLSSKRCASVFETASKAHHRCCPVAWRCIKEPD